MPRILWNLLFLLLTTTVAIAQDQATTTLQSTIESVTVYKKNARVLRQAKTNIPAGKSEIVLKQLSPKILINSIQVKLSNKSIALISAVPRINYLEETESSKRYESIKDSVDLLERELNEWTIKEQVLESTKETMMDNNPLMLSKNRDYTVDDVKKLMDFRQKELTAIKKELLEIEYKKLAIKKKQQLLKTQLASLFKSRQKPTGELVLQVQAATATSTEIEVAYVVTNAGWSPLYDLKSDGVGEPLALTYKAHVFQSTGIDWKQVQMVLSSSDPSLSHDRPILRPMDLSLGRRGISAKRKKGNTYIQYQGSGDVVLEQRAAKKRAIQQQALQIQQQSINTIVSPSDVSSFDEGEYLNSNGSRSSSNDVYIDGVRVVGDYGISETEITINDPDETFDDASNTLDFDLELLQDIPSDGKKHIVEISKNELDVAYEYHIVPKMEKNAFLLAKISNYGQYNLLSGPANIFFDGLYLGQSYIDARVTTDTLLMSLGRDEKIAVKRQKIKSLKKEQGAIIKENIRFQISIRNNKSKEIEVTLLDQIPLSKHKELEVKLLESTSAKYNTTYGSLRWVRKIKTNETLKLVFEYEVRYPKDKAVYRP